MSGIVSAITPSICMRGTPHDLYGIAATLSRTTQAIERKGEDGAKSELELTAAFADMAYRRMQATVAAFDENNDELLKGIASRSYGEGGYPFDIL